MGVSITNPGFSQSDADARYVKKTGDTMQGVLNFSTYGFDMTDANALRFLVDIDETSSPVGALRTTQISTTSGTAMGPPPFLWITYP